MINARLVNFFLLLTVISPGIFGQAPAVSGTSSGTTSSSSKFLPVSEVKEGMMGKARTVFKGTEPEEFNVEILGVVPGAIGPKQDLIVGRISGGNADRTAVFAGMSGSPVYVDGRLVGAISYSFPFSKEAICGITPIEQMLSIFEQRSSGPKAAREPGSVSFAEIASAQYDPVLPGSTIDSGQLVSVATRSSMLAAVAGQTFRPIGTPLTFTGISQSTLDKFAPALLSAGMIPVAAVGGSAAMSPMKAADAMTLQGGDSVSMQMTRGDISLSAAGTVTLRDGDKIYAFGHPFLSLGTSDLPMSESSVVTVIPNMNNSFKLAVPDAMVGTMTQDRATGVFGKLGVAPKMIPVRLNSLNSRGQKDTLNFEIARDDFLTPLLLNIAIYNSLTAQERSIGDSTILVSGTVSITGEQPVKIERRFTGGQASVQAAGSIAYPVNTLLRNSFDRLEIKGIELDFTTIDGSKSAVLERIAIDRSQVKPGETLEITAIARTNFGKVVVQRIPITIPLETPVGAITITIGDGSSIQKTEAIQHFVPNDLSDLITTLNKVKMSDRLYLKISRTTNGAIIGSSELPNLPPSVLATINSDRLAGGVKSSTQTVMMEKAIAPAEYLISGDQSLVVTVVN